MVPFFVFLVVTAVSAVIGLLATRRTGKSGKGWQRPLAHGMAVMFLVAASGHFVEPLRSGLIATVPPIVPFPDLVVTATGIVEIVFAAALLVPVSRRLAATAAVLYLLAVFPANVLAVTSVDHPDAPSTPLLLRALIQLVFITAAVVIARTGSGPAVRDILRALRPARQPALPKS
jgi:uncharacterized membrane protein